jgi:DNA-directed RNA polymerase subunit RPC12/RpoP
MFVPQSAASDKRPILCPHCKKPFDAELLTGATARYRGFKCPHCRLFVPAERAGSPRKS